MKDMKPDLRKLLRQQIIDEASITNYEDLSDTVTVSGKKFPKVYSAPNIFDNKFDEAQYIKDNKDDKQFGICSLALYGMEKQFTAQIEEGFFQTTQHADRMLGIERLILDDKSNIRKHIDSTNREIQELWDSMTSAERKKILLSIGTGTTVSAEDASLWDYAYLSDTIHMRFIEYIDTHQELFPSIRIKEHVYSKENPNKVKFQICNDITNPKLERGIYRACSEANLDNKQDFVINIRELAREGFKTDTYDDIRNINLPDIWTATRKEWKERLLKKVFPSLHITEIQDLATMDWDQYTYKITEELWNAYHEFSDQEIADMLDPRPDEYRWREKRRLSCWHNFLGLIEYPEAIKNKWLEIQLAYDAGEISEEQATKLIADLSKAEEMVKTKITEGNTAGFEKPTTYQPIRLRLYGSQRYINDLFNKQDFLLDQPLGIVTDNGPVITTIKESFKSWEVKQLLDNVLLSDNIIEQYKEYADVRAADIWELLEPGSRAFSIDYMGSQYFEGWYYDEHVTNVDFMMLVKTMDTTMDEWIDDMEIGVEIPDNIIKASYKKPIVFLGETFIEFLDDYDEFFPHDHEALIHKEYPNMNLDFVEYILERDDAESWSFDHDIEVRLFMPYESIEKKVKEWIDDQESEIEWREKDIEKKKKEIVENAGLISEYIEVLRKQILWKKENDINVILDDISTVKDLLSILATQAGTTVSI